MLLPLVLIGLLLMHGGLAAILEPSHTDHAAAPMAPTPRETAGALPALGDPALEDPAMSAMVRPDAAAATHGRMPAAAEHPDHVGPLCLAVLRDGLGTTVAGLLLGLLGVYLAGCPVRRSATPGAPGGNRRAPPSRSPPLRPPTLAALCVLRL